MSMKMLALSGLVVALAFLAGPIYAVEPTYVNFGAKKEEETAILRKIEASLQRLVGVKRATFTQLLPLQKEIEKLRGRKLSLEAYSALLDFYFLQDSPATSEISTLLSEHANEGNLPPHVLPMILEKTKTGTLAEVVILALQKRPDLKTLELQQTVHRELGRVLNRLELLNLVSPYLLRLVDPATIEEDRATFVRFRQLASQAGPDGFANLLLGNPKLAPLLSRDFPLLTIEQIEAVIARRYFIGLRLRAGLGPIRRTPEAEQKAAKEDLKISGRKTDTRALSSEVAFDVHQAVMVASEDRLRRVLSSTARPMFAVASNHELPLALALLDEKTSEPYLSDLQRQAVHPDLSDAIRETVIRILSLAQRRHPELRKTILASAAMLKAPSHEFRRLRLQVVEMNCSTIFKPSR